MAVSSVHVFHGHSGRARAHFCPPSEEEDYYFICATCLNPDTRKGPHSQRPVAGGSPGRCIQCGEVTTQRIYKPLMPKGYVVEEGMFGGGHMDICCVCEAVETRKIRHILAGYLHFCFRCWPLYADRFWPEQVKFPAKSISLWERASLLFKRVLVFFIPRPSCVTRGRGTTVFQNCRWCGSLFGDGEICQACGAVPESQLGGSYTSILCQTKVEDAEK